MRQKVPLEYILEHERRSHALVGEALIREFKRLAPAEEQAEGLAELSRFLVDFVSTFATASSAAFAAAEQAWLTSVAHGRVQSVQGLLSGALGGADAERRLSYEVLNRVHVGLIVFRRDRRRVDLDRVAAQVLAHWGAKRHLIIPGEDGAVWAWGSFLDVIVPSSELNWVIPEEAVVAAGRPLTGADGFRRTHREAVVAERVARIAHAKSAPLVRFEDVRLISLLTADPRAAEAFVRDELGPLGQVREAHLRETVRVYLECNCSPATAASRLNVVKNTIVYRIRRAEELLGHSVKERQSILWVALHLVDVIGLPQEEAASEAASSASSAAYLVQRH
ncbi:PucR family transcriptional regulator [Microbacterium sp. HMH0099]|uniref:PucR family transcriptional regulator n=1 Tax=Microbacterium sp. HMH0099 TaxID=3414026 RepID=UPI003BF67868